MDKNNVTETLAGEPQRVPADLDPVGAAFARVHELEAEVAREMRILRARLTALEAALAMP